MVEQLSGDNIVFRIFCSDYDADGSTLQGVRKDCWVSYDHNVFIWYCSKDNTKINSFKKIVAEINPAFIFINGIYSWFFTMVPVLFCKTPKKIISVRGMLHPGALSQKPFKKKAFLFLWRLTGIHKKHIFHVTDDAERKYVQGVFGENVKTFTAPNFPRKLSASHLYKQPGILKLVSIALISPMKNHLLVLKALQQCTSTVEYNIYGPVKDAGYWQQCMEQVKQLPSNTRVYYHGDIIPSGVEKCLSVNHVFILPSKSENFGHSFYEAFSAGKPVITSYFTPWNLLEEKKAGINIDIAAEKKLATAIDFFSGMDDNEFKNWSAGAVVFAENAVDYKKIKEQYRNMFSVK